MFVNTQEFRREAIYHQKHDKYDCGIKGSNEYKRWWAEQRNRCLYGYSVGGIWITGYHYYYLNFNKIQSVNKLSETSKAGGRKLEFPKFWDLDYLFFRSIHIAKYGISVEELKKLPYIIPIKEDSENLAGGHHLIWLKQRGSGAPQPEDEIVITKNGERQIKDINIGDIVYSRDGNEYKVTNKYNQSYQEVYKVELLDGRIIECGGNHLWTIEDRVRNGKKHYIDITTEKMLYEGLIYSHSTGQKTYKYKIPEISPVKFSKKELPIHPYIVGAMLGDGTINGHNLKISTDDIEIVNNFKKILGNDYDLIPDPTNNNFLIKIINPYKQEYKDQGYCQKGGGRINPLNREFKKLGLKVKCKEKFIPEIYKYGSIKQRVELVRGLMDTDGSVTKAGACEFTNSNEKLIDDLTYVLRSLGISCNKGKDNREGIKEIISRNGRKIKANCKPVFRLYITTNKDIFSLTRKLKRLNKNRNTRTSTPIVNIVNTGIIKKHYCLEVNSKDHLYLTKDFVPTHNSNKNSSMASRNFHLIPDSKTYMFASDKQYLNKDGIYSKFQELRSWVNTHTEFAVKSDFKKGQGEMHFRASYDDGNGNEKGLRSEVIGISTNGDPEKGRGKRGILLLYEEGGKFPEMDTTWNIARDSVEEGGIVYGTLIGFGTGGSEGADFRSMELMFYNPKAYNILAFNNIHDIGMEGSDCALFTPAQMNIQLIDKNGNSDLEKGQRFVNKIIEEANLSPDVTLVSRRKAENPSCPRDAMLSVDTNKFAREELVLWRNNLSSNKRYKQYGTPKSLYTTSDGKVEAKINLDAQPIIAYPHSRKQDLRGCVVEYTTPYRNEDGTIPENLYIIGHDPFADDDAQDVTSLGSAYVYMNPNNIVPNDHGDRIVASYNGRPRTTDEYNYNLFLLARRWNAKIGFESDRGDVISYAKRFKLLDWLAPEFELGWDEKIKITNSSTYRYGMRMGSGKLNTKILTGNKYIEDWLFEMRGEKENSDIVCNFHYIYDLGLLDELRFFNGNGNYDRLSALRIIMYYSRELIYNETQIAPKKNKNKSFSKFINGK